eukprot:CAMPEP_0198210028 /NCGR_PEP_ID=MMETSP1445-20131203/18665_1 /TAXON_ID=36898 /ORGANISM="Pyramimonas sp., Strain CCMP2087" /LENGTH=113 /DNA_ID=CAMNT_0043883975 /DNA_START=118 /DNA_END=456 /DNA_ORIENTATION=+
MARFTVLQVFLVLGALIGAAEGSFNCDLYQTTCVASSLSLAYENCAATVVANTGGPDKHNMTCRVEHLGRAVNSDATLHCPHAAPNATGPCASELLVAPIASPTTASPTTASP